MGYIGVKSPTDPNSQRDIQIDAFFSLDSIIFSRKTGEKRSHPFWQVATLWEKWVDPLKTNECPREKFTSWKAIFFPRQKSQSFFLNS